MCGLPFDLVRCFIRLGFVVAAILFALAVAPSSQCSPGGRRGCMRRRNGGWRRCAIFQSLMRSSFTANSLAMKRERRRERESMSYSDSKSTHSSLFPERGCDVWVTHFFLGASFVLSDEALDLVVASNGLVLSGPVRRLDRKRFSQATPLRDNSVPRHSKPCNIVSRWRKWLILLSARGCL